MEADIKTAAEAEMTKDQVPRTDETPNSNVRRDFCPNYDVHRAENHWVIGTWGFIGPWNLVIQALAPSRLSYRNSPLVVTMSGEYRT
jgi:hypothetical protein